MSIWADNVMTPSSDNGIDNSPIARQNEITATASLRRKTVHQPQYGLDAIESFPADDFDAKKMPNSETHQYSIRRQIIANAIRGSQSGNSSASSGGIKAGALSFIKNLGVFFPRRQQQHHSEATVENCEVLENYNASMATANPVPSGTLMPNRSTLATNSSRSSNSSLSGNSSKQLCGLSSAKDELILSAKCDNNCDNSVARLSEKGAGDPVILVVADVRNVTSLPVMGVTDASSFALPRVNLKTR